MEAHSTEVLPPNPWQSPPAFLWHSLIDLLLLHEPLRVALLCIAPLRQVCSSWNAAVGTALPVLAPRPHVPLDELAAAAAHLPGLRLLRIERPGTDQVQRRDIAAEQAAGLAALCAACPGLRSLHLLRWQHLPEALEPLAALTALRTLEIASHTLHMGAGVLATLAQLPRLRRLALQCRSLDSAGLAALTGLTSLDLTPDTWAAEAALMPSLAQLTSLRHLGLDGPSPALLAGLPQLTALQQLSSLALLRADLGPATEHGAQPLQALLQLLQGLRDSSDSTAGGSSSSRRQQGLRQLRLASSQSDPDAAASRLPLSALRGLEGLSVAYPSLQVSCSRLAHLAGLTALTLDALLLEEQHDPDKVGPFVAAIGRRLTGLRQLHLLGAQHLEEVALEQLADLTRLTSLCLDQAFDFGSRALWALTHLPSLRRLALSGTSLNRYSLLSLLSNDDEDGPPALLPGLTYLALRNCQLLSGPEVAQLVLALPSLRRFLHSSWPALQSAQLRRMLEQKPGLQLLETTWRPAAAPDLPSGGAPPSERQREQQRRHDEDMALCQAFRLRLHHSLASESVAVPQASLFEWDAEQALLAALQPGT